MSLIHLSEQNAIKKAFVSNFLFVRSRLAQTMLYFLILKPTNCIMGGLHPLGLFQLLWKGNPLGSCIEHVLLYKGTKVYCSNIVGTHERSTSPPQPKSQLNLCMSCSRWPLILNKSSSRNISKGLLSRRCSIFSETVVKQVAPISLIWSWAQVTICVSFTCSAHVCVGSPAFPKAKVNVLMTIICHFVWVYVWVVPCEEWISFFHALFQCKLWIHQDPEQDELSTAYERMNEQMFYTELLLNGKSLVEGFCMKPLRFLINWKILKCKVLMAERMIRKNLESWPEKPQIVSQNQASICFCLF